MTTDPRDPQLKEFVERMQAAWREHPPLSSLPLSEARRVAEIVRSRFADGGPSIRETTNTYVPFAKNKVDIRIYNPVRFSQRPALLYLHGGGWRLFSVKTHDRIMREYAARADMVVVGVEYSLSPDVQFPHAIDEVIAVIHWLQEHGSEYGINTSRLALGGDSAGAALTLSTCLKLRDAGETHAIKAMVLNYGCFDPACNSPSYERYGTNDFLWDPGEMQLYWSNYLGDTDPSDPIAAPIHADHRGLPPAFLVIAECDVLFDDSIALEKKLRATGVSVHSTIYARATHSFLEAISIARVSEQAFNDTARWLNKQF